MREGGVLPPENEPRPGRQSEQEASDAYDRRMAAFHDRQQEDHDREHRPQWAGRHLPPWLRGLDQPDRVEDE